MSRSPISKPAGNTLPPRSSIDQIKAALRTRNYRLFADSQVGPKGEQISWWSDGDYTVILHEYRQGMGCELYVQATIKNSVEETIRQIPTTGSWEFGHKTDARRESTIGDRRERTPAEITRSASIQAEHAANETRARKEGLFVHSDPLRSGGGLLYGPTGIVGALSLGGFTQEERKPREEALSLLIELANEAVTARRLGAFDHEGLIPKLDEPSETQCTAVEPGTLDTRCELTIGHDGMHFCEESGTFWPGEEVRS